jgi:signal transduction histidine kinase
VSSRISADTTPSPRRRLSLPSPFVADSLFVVALLLLAAYEYSHPGDDGFQAGPFALNAPLTVAELLPLAFRRRAPLTVYLLMNAVVTIPSLFVAHTLFAYSGSFPLALAMYTVARHREWRVSRWTPLIAVASSVIYSFHAPAVRDASDIIFGTIVYSLALGLGVTLRRQAAQRAALADALAQLGREQEQRARLAVLDERARLARDLHDVVAHAVAVMLVQVGASRLALDDDPEAAREGLLNAEQTGREATGDLRRLLGLLRATDESEVLVPAPGVAGLPALREQMVRAGLDVELEVIGDPPPLSPSLDLSVYRVVQEALTNVLKHAGPTTVRVRLDYSDPSSEGLRIEVVDAGPQGTPGSRSAPPTSGHGLVGMRERVELFGGRVHAAQDSGGFAVVVDLPLPRTSAIA